MFNEDRVSVGEGDKVLETDDGDGCKQYMYLMPLSCALESR